MPKRDNRPHREKAEEILSGLARTPSRYDEVAATVGLAYTMLAMLDELHDIGERAYPTPKGKARKR